MVRLNYFFKRVFDIIFSIIGIIILIPEFIIIGLLIKIDSKGPVIFKQERIGKDGKKFIIYKFRTMKANINPYLDSPSSNKDPRITKIGRWLREYSIDELPQLFNILKGDMSFVGPRPLLDYEIEMYDKEHKRLVCKPGVTGWAQINGRNELDWDKKIEMDIWYCNNFNLLLDLKILFKTIITLFKREGIYDINVKDSNKIGGKNK